MDRRNLFIHQITGVIYVTLQSVILFYAVKFVATRMYFDFVPEFTVVWVIGLGWILFLPLAYLKSSYRNLWLLLAAAASSLLAAYIIGYSFFLFIMAGILAWAISRRGMKTVSKSDFTRLFLYGIFWFCVALLLTFPFTYSDSEIDGLIRFFSLAMLTMLVGVLVSVLINLEYQNDLGSFGRSWGLYSTMLMGGAAGLIIISLLPAYIIGLIFSVLRVLLLWVLSPFKWLVEISPALKEEIYKLWAKQKIKGANDENLRGLPESIYNKIREYIHQYDYSFLKYIFILLAVSLLVMLIYLFLRRDPEEMRERPVKKFSLQAQNIETGRDESQSSWLQRAKNLFLPYAGKEEHLIRREFRQILKMLREVELWQHDRMTVDQISQAFVPLNPSTKLYQKVRYGDQDLSAEELRLFREEAEKVKENLRQIIRDREGNNG